MRPVHAATAAMLCAITSMMTSCAAGTADTSPTSDATAKLSGDAPASASRPDKAAAGEVERWCSGVRNWPLPLCPVESAPFLDGVLNHRGPAIGKFHEPTPSHDYEFWTDSPIYDGGTGSLTLTVLNLDVVPAEDRESRRMEALGKGCGVSVTVAGVKADACTWSAKSSNAGPAVNANLAGVDLTWERDGKVFKISVTSATPFTPEELAEAVSKWPYDAEVWGPVRSGPDDITNAVWMLMGDGARNLSNDSWDCLVETISEEVEPDVMHHYEASGTNPPVDDPALAQTLGEIVVGCVPVEDTVTQALLGMYETDSPEVACIAESLNSEAYLNLVVSGLMRTPDGATALQQAAARCLPQ